MPRWILLIPSVAALASAACGGASITPAEPYDASPEASARQEIDASPILSYGTAGADAAAQPAPEAGATFATCAASVAQAQPLPLDLVLLLDTSGSMADLAAPGESKWRALVQAFTAFVDDPASSGLGVAVHYFPLPPPGVPLTCASNAACGTAGPCLVGQCDDITDLPCATDDDCFYGGACQPTATCSGDPNFTCGPLGSACGSDENGFDLGTCGAAPAAYCADSDSCAASDYLIPALAMATLPGAADAVVASLEAQVPRGGTPTPSALQGALTAAATYAGAHPSHDVAVILATDGVPDEVASLRASFCADAQPGPSNAALARLAAGAAAAAPPIETFALGVFAPDEVDAGVASLAPIAAAGGSGQPFIVETGADAGAGAIESQLVAALNGIRAATLPCHFAIPAPEAGTPDFGRVNVRLTSGGVASSPPYVATANDCGAVEGWTYDADPATGALPTTIGLCPATCARVHADPSARVDILLGCTTVVR